MVDWHKRRVLVTGGASFIGSALVARLIEYGAQVSVADDLSSGRLENIAPFLDAGRIAFHRGDLRESSFARECVAGQDVVFHLAADHGGRGYVDTHQAACAGNLLLDGNVFRACVEASVSKIVYASSGCVYPNHLQQDASEELYLQEPQVGPPYDADNTYGWAKLMGEMTLRALAREAGINCVSCRYFTVYGEGGVENHAIIALIARARAAQDPYEVWGTGEQIRNWTYVGDIVAGTIRAAEVVSDGTAINLGTTERVRVIDAVHQIFAIAGYTPTLRFRPDMPVGPTNRVADNTLARTLLGWTPKVPFHEGLRRTMDWYYKTRSPQEAMRRLETTLLAR
jgi:nucleoside-diphosphate-sugar epimerase